MIDVFRPIDVEEEQHQTGQKHAVERPDDGTAPSRCSWTDASSSLSFVPAGTQLLRFVPRLACYSVAPEQGRCLGRHACRPQHRRRRKTASSPSSAWPAITRAPTSSASVIARAAARCCSPHTALKDENWPRESIDETFYMPDVQKEWKLEDALLGVSFMARNETIDRIVALDDFDVETAATLREHLRVPGMGDTTARYFRDKLAMRTKARDEGLLVPEFIHVLNYDQLREFMQRVPPPWVLKPRSMAGSMGIKKIHNCRRILGGAGTARRQAIVLSAGAVCARRHLPRRLDLLRAQAAVLHRQPLRAPADGCLAGGRHLHHPHAAAGIEGSAAADRT